MSHQELLNNFTTLNLELDKLTLKLSKKFLEKIPKSFSFKGFFNKQQEQSEYHKEIYSELNALPEKAARAENEIKIFLGNKFKRLPSDILIYNSSDGYKQQSAAWYYKNYLPARFEIIASSPEEKDAADYLSSWWLVQCLKQALSSLQALYACILNSQDVTALAAQLSELSPDVSQYYSDLKNKQLAETTPNLKKELEEKLNTLLTKINLVDLPILGKLESQFSACQQQILNTHAACHEKLRSLYPRQSSVTVGRFATHTDVSSGPLTGASEAAEVCDAIKTFEAVKQAVAPNSPLGDPQNKFYLGHLFLHAAKLCGVDNKTPEQRNQLLANTSKNSSEKFCKGLVVLQLLRELVESNNDMKKFNEIIASAARQTYQYGNQRTKRLFSHRHGWRNWFCCFGGRSTTEKKFEALRELVQNAH